MSFFFVKTYVLVKTNLDALVTVYQLSTISKFLRPLALCLCTCAHQLHYANETFFFCNRHFVCSFYWNRCHWPCSVILSLIYYLLSTNMLDYCISNAKVAGDSRVPWCCRNMYNNIRLYCSLTIHIYVGNVARMFQYLLLLH